MNLSAEDPFLFSTRSEIPEFLLRETRQKIHLHQIKLCRTWYHVIPVLVQGTLQETGDRNKSTRHSITFFIVNRPGVLGVLGVLGV